MKNFSSKMNYLLLILLAFGASTRLRCEADPGDLIRHTPPKTTTHSSVSTYRVTGWQNQLTNVTPNLGNYYWEPMTKRVINTTRTTSKGATAAPPIVTRGAQYIKPIHTRMLVVNHPQPQLAVAEALPAPLPARTFTNTGLSYSTNAPLVLSYQNNTSLNWANRKRPEATTAEVAGARETVYGVLKTPISVMRAKTRSL